MVLRLTTLLLLLPLAHSLLAQPSLRRPLSATPVARPIRVPTILAQEGGAFDQEGGRERSRSAVIAKPKPKAKAKNKEDVEKEGSWSVLLHNDDVRARQPAGPALPAQSCDTRPAQSHQVHTFDYVNMAIVQAVQTITRKKAHRICVQAHSMGTATVTTSWKQQAKQYCLKLQKYGLTSSIAPEGGL